MPDVQKRLFELVAALFGHDRDSLKPETQFDKDLVADELDMVELIMDCEDEFDISIDDGEYDHLKTLADLQKLIQEKLIHAA